MQLKHIEYFVETSKHRSFNEAAKSLFISQPSLSAAIATLENELNFKLFNRTKSGITLTTAGQLILPEAQKMLEIQAHWKSLGDKMSLFEHPLQIFSQELLCSTILFDLSMKLQSHYPDLSVELTPIENINPPDHLENDCIFVGFYEPDQFAAIKEKSISTNWTIETVAELQSFLYINAQHPLAKRDKITVADLAQINVLTYSAEKQSAIPEKELLTSFADIKRLPSREGMFNYIQRYPDYCGLFSSLCAYLPSVQSGHICAKTIADHPMPLVLAAIFSRDEDLAPFYETLVGEICETTTAFLRANRCGDIPL